MWRQGSNLQLPDPKSRARPLGGTTVLIPRNIRLGANRLFILPTATAGFEPAITDYFINKQGSCRGLGPLGDAQLGNSINIIGPPFRVKWWVFLLRRTPTETSEQSFTQSPLGDGEFQIVVSSLEVAIYKDDPITPVS